MTRCDALQLDFRKKFLLILFGLTAAAVLIALGQANTTRAAPLLEFEVASVKPAKSGSGHGVTGSCHGIDSTHASTQTVPPLGRCVINDARLSHLINMAYDLHSNVLLKAGPDWIARGDERFNIEAKAENPETVTEQQLLEMLQTLLADRFKLRFHRETVEMAGFAMILAKGGPKLKESSSAEVITRFDGGSYKPMRDQPIALTARKYSMPMLADLLSGIGVHGPVIDKTGLQGAYDFALSWDEDAGPDLSTALREQLGLRLEAEKKVPVASFVVDSAQKPAEN
jgi:uncharacterized protein (TIGR03435 family)